MKLKLLLGTLMLTVITANAQVATINETFDNFTLGNTTFPQNNWSAVVATNILPYPPAPMMIVAGTTDKFIQSYAGNSGTSPSYLIAPQIVAPSGDKSVSFIASLAATSPGTGTIQVGLASNPADMSTFVAVGNAISLTSTTYQNYSVPVPASASSYLVFKFTPTAAHTAIQLDNVVYNATASLAVTDVAKSREDIKFVVNTDNTALQFVTKKDPKNIQIYSASGQKTAEGKLNGQKFDISGLQPGVYYMLIETAKGSVTQSKFIKK